MAEILHSPRGRTLEQFLVDNLASDSWTSFRAAVAFVKWSGVSLIAELLAHFHARGGVVKISSGVNFGGTSKDGLQGLLEALGDQPCVWIFHNERGPTFHPKVYVFANADEAEILLGSGNLTEGGLSTNYEAGLRLRLDLSATQDQETYDHLVTLLDSWIDEESTLVHILTPEFLEKLHEQGYVPEEVASRPENGDGGGGADGAGGLFGHEAVTRPRRQRRRQGMAASAGGAPVENFVMWLRRTDAGAGQTTPGTSRRSPEIFIPVVALNQEPGYWKFPDAFTEDPAKPGKFDRIGVPVLFNGRTLRVNLFRNPIKDDLRIRNSVLRDSANIGDILHLQRTDGAQHEYAAELIRQGSPEFDEFFELCDQQVKRPSDKRFGYY